MYFSVQLCCCNSLLSFFFLEYFVSVLGIPYWRRNRCFKSKERRYYVNTPWKLIAAKYVSMPSNKQYTGGTGAIKRPETVKPPLLYGKSDFGVDTTKKITPQKRAAPIETESNPKIEQGEKRRRTKAPLKKLRAIAPPSVDPSPDGPYELSPLMSKMVDAELDDLMAKIQDIPPEDANDEAEKVVLEKFRTTAGDSLRNTLGLNVTKRLLNVHNQLYVKITFSVKPNHRDLTNFIRTHKLSAVKQLSDRGVIFAAKMQSFQDFDELNTKKNLKCGTAHVTVTLCYRFMKCPPNLRTCFDGKEGTINKSASFSRQVAKHQEIIPTNKPQTDSTTKQNNPVESREATKPNEKKNASITARAPASKQNVTPNVTPTTKHQAVAVNKVAPAMTAVPATENKQAASDVTPAKPRPATDQDSYKNVIPAKANQAALQMQKPGSTVTPVKQNPAVAKKENAAKNVAPIKPGAANSHDAAVKATPSKPVAAANQNSAPTTTPSKPVAVNNQNTAPKPTPPKPAAPNQNSAPTTTPSKPVAVNKQNTTLKPTPPKPAAANQNSAPTTTPSKPVAVNKQNTTLKPTPPKPAAANQNSAPTTTPSKPVAVNKQNTTLKPTPPKPAAANQNSAPTTTPSKPVAVNNQNTTQKPTPPKPAAANQNSAPTTTPSKPVAVNNQNTAPKPTLSKPAAANYNQKVASKPPAKPNQMTTGSKLKPAPKVTKQRFQTLKSKQIPSKPTNDFDELDDHAILALITEGIVLDECSGSDEGREEKGVE